MKRIYILILMLLCLGCETKYRAEMVKPDGSVDVYELVDDLSCWMDISIAKDGAIYMQGKGVNYRFEPGKYVGWSLKEKGVE